MKYTKEERLDIGRRIYEKEMNRAEAALAYDISMSTARDYMRLYKAARKLDDAKAGTPPDDAKAGLSPDSAKAEPAFAGERRAAADRKKSSGAPGVRPEDMTREELIQEVYRLRGRR